MRWHGDIHIDRVTPAERDVLRALGVPAGRETSDRARAAVAAGIEELRSVAVARGIYATVAARDFAKRYDGEGDNETPSPLAEVFPRADELALFAVTVGHEVTARIASLFAAGDYAIGGALDAAASEAAERAAEHVTRSVLAEARNAGQVDAGARALRYSPGYCGWALTGQRALFAALRPGDIGITLSESCLMEPVKSVSGVVVIGPAGIHEFDDGYEFCGECATHECRDRIARLADDAEPVG